MAEVKLTRTNVRQALNTLSDWFPEEAEDISLYKKELIDLIVSGEEPRMNSKLGRMVYRRLPVTPASRRTEEPLFTPCETAIAGAVVSAGIFVVSVVGLKVTYNTNIARAMERQMGKQVLNGFRTMLKEFMDSENKFQAASRLFKIAGSIWQGSGFKVIFEAWKKEAKWYDFVLAGVTLIAQLTIWFASDGVAFVAEVALVIVGAVSLGLSIKDAVNTCAGSKSPQYEAPTFKPLGSYLLSSKNQKVVLSAKCLDVKRNQKDSSIEITDLATNIFIENIDGKLINKKQEVFTALKFKPLGSYPETSKSIKVVLSASCKNKKGNYVNSQIDITNFSTTQKLANVDGVLKKE